MSSLLRLSLPQAATGSAPGAPRGLVIVASTRPQWKVKKSSGRGAGAAVASIWQGAAAVRGWGPHRASSSSWAASGACCTCRRPGEVCRGHGKPASQRALVKQDERRRPPGAPTPLVFRAPSSPARLLSPRALR